MRYTLTDADGSTAFDLTVDFEALSFVLKSATGKRSRKCKNRASLIWAVDAAFAELLGITQNRDEREIQLVAVMLANLREIFGNATFTRHWDSTVDIVHPAENTAKGRAEGF